MRHLQRFGAGVCCVVAFGAFGYTASHGTAWLLPAVYVLLFAVGVYIVGAIILGDV